MMAGKKWIHYFEGTECVLFVCSLGDYDEQSENGKKNALRESLQVFATILEEEALKGASLFVMLNKAR